MTNKLTYKISDEKNEKICEKIHDGLIAFNDHYLGHYKVTKYTIACYDEKKNLVGGAFGDVLFNDYLRITMLWVDEKYRKLKVGTNLIKHAENVANVRGCKFIQLDTFDFQAKAFYLKNGFQLIGTIEKWVHGYDLHFMRKEVNISK